MDEEERSMDIEDVSMAEAPMAEAQSTEAIAVTEAQVAPVEAVGVADSKNVAGIATPMVVDIPSPEPLPESDAPPALFVPTTQTAPSAQPATSVQPATSAQPAPTAQLASTPQPVPAVQSAPTSQPVPTAQPEAPQLEKVSAESAPAAQPSTTGQRAPTVPAGRPVAPRPPPPSPEEIHNAKLRLKRFCVLGSTLPIYIHLRRYINVSKTLPVIQKLVKKLEPVQFMEVVRDVLKIDLIRRDELLFMYAVYFASPIDFSWKTSVRHTFTLVTPTDDDLFRFSRYASLVCKAQKRKCFSRTIRKAIRAWYTEQSIANIRSFWASHVGNHGFTHKALIKLCRIDDFTIGSKKVVEPFFKSCTKLLREAGILTEIDKAANQLKDHPGPITEEPGPSKEGKGNGKNYNDNLPIRNGGSVQPGPSSTVVRAKKRGRKKKSKNKPGNSNNKDLPEPAPVPIDMQLAIAQLRTTKDVRVVANTITKFKLSYLQVPGHFLLQYSVMKHTLHTMPYLVILKYWHKMGKFEHFTKEKKLVLRKCKKTLTNLKFIKKSRIHPIHILMCRYKCSSDITYIKSNPKQRINYNLEFLDILYRKSFECLSSVNVRMHITVNLQSNYKKKYLKNHKDLTYYEALRALSIGYCRQAAKADVFYWIDAFNQLENIHFKNNVDSAFSAFDKVEIAKCKQRLACPLTTALNSDEVYDVFLCIVPTGSFGNPQQKSEYLCEKLDQYRTEKNSNARFIILNLLKYNRGSMTYSNIRTENILEICGLDNHTTDIIHNFATHRFV